MKECVTATLYFSPIQLSICEIDRHRNGTKLNETVNGNDVLNDQLRRCLHLDSSKVVVKAWKISNYQTCFCSQSNLSCLVLLYTKQNPIM
jgi:hypothetical protein